MKEGRQERIFRNYLQLGERRWSSWGATRAELGMVDPVRQDTASHVVFIFRPGGRILEGRMAC